LAASLFLANVLVETRGGVFFVEADKGKSLRGVDEGRTLEHISTRDANLLLNTPDGSQYQESKTA